MPTPLRVFAALCGLSVLSLSSLHAQLPPPPPLRVYLDCGWCDFDYLRREIPSVDYVRDPADADLHVLVTDQETGAGGTEFTFHFMGKGTLAGRADTLRYTSGQNDTDDEVREGYAHTFRVGLVRYLAYTARIGDVEVVFRAPPVGGEAPPAARPDDPWNLWVFRAEVSGELEGESRTKATAVDGSFSASRTTEAFKIDMNVSGQYQKDEFELSSGEDLVSIAKDVGGEGVAVWSLTPHWSWGLSASAQKSTSLNQSLAVRAAPALEYSFYPYAESTRRQVTVLYRVGVASFQYETITLFDKMSETRPEQSLEVAADFTQPWGNLLVALTGSHFLDDVAQHRIEFDTNLEIRLFRGVNLDVRGNVARIKDQIYVAREETSDQEVLLRRKELGTDFRYSVDVGLSFTFGSVFNNVVNPRIRTRSNEYH